MLDNAICEFKKYTSNFDLSVELLSMKYYHAFRVVDYAKKILESITDDKYIIELGLVAALLHDIARFEQYTIYHTYNDKSSFDHGQRGYEILKGKNYIFNYVKTEEEQEIVLNAVRKHSNKVFELTGNDLMDTIAKVVRDADKLDIMITQSNEVFDSNYQLNEKLIDDLLDNRLCDYNNIENKDDNILCVLGFVFDINFKESFNIIKNSKIVDTKIKALKECNNDPAIDIIEKEINEYIEKNRR